jgi:hypothetical protein
MRQVGYRAALTALVFTGLWFVLGLFLLWTPVPGALGIRGEMFVGWLMLFFAELAISGLFLFIAAINGIFPRTARPARSAEALWAAPPLPPAALPSRPESRRRASGQGR